MNGLPCEEGDSMFECDCCKSCTIRNVRTSHLVLGRNWRNPIWPMFVACVSNLQVSAWTLRKRHCHCLYFCDVAAAVVGERYGCIQLLLRD
ncbi:hypothetical protein O3P69_002656 [Scylla paramamosain]|uniref:Uncharacterized protein n=1 Tax=Scylla paramamosain TaxID=85552 RepID=A0AAW0ULJ8_SCYPA